MNFLFQSEKEFQFSEDHFYKFMFVRHPMERLVSCYYDKMMTNPHKSLRAFRKAVKIRARRIMARAGHNSDFETLSSQRTKRSASEKKGKEKKNYHHFEFTYFFLQCKALEWEI